MKRTQAAIILLTILAVLLSGRPASAKPTALRVVIYPPSTNIDPATGRFDYLVTAGVADSVTARVECLRERLATAERETADDGAAVQKVFVAPEWYFRKREGSFTEAEKGQIISGLTGLSAAFPRWLIVPGSIFWGMPGQTCPWSKEGKKARIRTRVFNQVPVLFAGKVIYTYSKLYDADIMKPRPAGGYSPTALSDTEFWGMYRDVSGTGDVVRPKAQNGWADEAMVMAQSQGLFKAGDLSVGLEVCRDHAESLLMKYHADDPIEYRISKGPDLHIVITCSCGMVPGKIIARSGGFGIHAEGDTGNEERKILGASNQVYAIKRDARGVLDFSSKVPVHRRRSAVVERRVSGSTIADRLFIYDVMPFE